jgi:hypothetical protein
MQIVAKRVTGNVGDEGQAVYVQQIVVSGLHDGELSDACDSAFKQWKEQGLDVQFRDDGITEEVKTRIFQSLFDKA